MSENQTAADPRPSASLCMHNFVEVEFQGTFRVAVNRGKPVVVEATASTDIRPWLTCVDCGLRGSPSQSFQYPWDFRSGVVQRPSAEMIEARIVAVKAIRDAPTMIAIWPGGSAEDAARLQRGERIYGPSPEDADAHWEANDEPF